MVVTQGEAEYERDGATRAFHHEQTDAKARESDQPPQ
jgi:hypothetical protein